MLQPTSCVVPQPGVVSDVVAGETVLLPPRSGSVLVLNELGTAVWQLADGSRTIREIVAQIQAEYEVGQSEAEADVLAFVAELAQRNLVSLR